MRAKSIVLWLGVVVGLTGAARAMEAPVAVAPGTVAPGEAGGGAVVRGSCPTFHWSEVDAAEGYELAILRFEPHGEPGEGEPGDGEPGDGERTTELYRVRLPGRVQGWTPTVERCLEPGARYAWALRALAGDQVGPWSEPRIFEIAGAPTTAEVEQALSVLRRWLDRDATAAPESSRAVGDAEPAPADAVPADRPSAARQDTHAEEHTSKHALDGPSNPHQRPAPTAPAVAPTPGASSLTIDQQLHLGSATHIFKEGELLLWEDGAAAITSLGRDALGENTTGINNTAVGALALHANDVGSNNTAVGASAMHENVAGSDNTAVGYEALGSNLNGVRNTAVGVSALHASTEITAINNVAVGFEAMGEKTSGMNNTAVGTLALHEGTEGSFNTAMGMEALGHTTGDGNSAFGVFAMHDNTSGADNSALGRRSLIMNEDGSENVGLGVDALQMNLSGNRNTAVGPRAGLNATTGNDNVGVGVDALLGDESANNGSRNTAVGPFAGQNATTGDDNIYIGSGAEGVAGEANTIRIGGTTIGTGNGQQNRTFINGISGVTVGNEATVLIDTITGQLGTVSSSRRYKEDIRDMEEASRRLLELRPVTFRYKEGRYEEGPLEASTAERARPLEYGLIAEEVAESFPELVVYDELGRPQTVRYHLLSSLLLNELQRIDQRSRSEGERLRALEERNRTLEARLREQSRNVHRLRAEVAKKR